MSWCPGYLRIPALCCAACGPAKQYGKVFLAAVCAITLLIVTVGSAVASSEPPASPEATTPGIAASDVLSNTQYYNRIQDYLTRRVEQSAALRSAYFQPDYSSRTQYEASIQGYRQDLQEMLAVPPSCLAREAPVLVEEQYITTQDGVAISKLELSVCQGELTLWGLLGRPVAATGRLPLAIAYHGSYGKAEGIFGIADPYYNNDYHRTFALRMAKKGYVVFAPQVLTDYSGDYNQIRNGPDNRGTSLGERLVGIELGEMINGLDYLTQLDFVNADRVVTYGISLGGLMSFYLGALDTRIHTTAVSNYIEDRVGKLTGLEFGPVTYPEGYWRINNADYMFVPSLLRRLTDVEIAAIIAPRRLFVETGLYDYRSWTVPPIYAQIETVYQRLGLGDSVDSVIGVGGHEIFFDDAVAFMSEIIPDVTAPSGMIEVANGLQATSIPTITLWLTATDDSGSVSTMQVSQDPAMGGTAWQTYTNSLLWVLNPIEGRQQIFSRFRDAAGNLSDVYSTTVILDSQGPGGSVAINGGAQVTQQAAVTLSLAAADATTGVREMRVAEDPQFAAAQWQPYASELAWTLSSGDGEKIVYVQFRDRAGNLSQVYSATITLDKQGGLLYYYLPYTSR